MRLRNAALPTCPRLLATDRLSLAVALGVAAAKTPSANMDMLSGCFGVYASMIQKVGFVIGLVIALRFVFEVYTFIKVYILSPVFNLGADLKAMGEWAVVTGATDGIGKGYARQLAKRGMNIALISRSQDKLDNTAKEIEREFGVRTKCIALELSQVDTIHSTVAEKLSGLDIGVLVNNVGVTPKYSMPFSEQQDVSFMRYLIDLNIYPVTLVTNVVLPKMVAKGKGAILNISSGAGISPCPMMVPYTSTKAYVDFFTRAIQAECRDQGVIVQVVHPFFVSTKLTVMDPSIFVPTPDAYAHSQLSTVGLKEQTTGYWSHALQGYGVKLTPNYLREKMFFSLSHRMNESRKAKEK